MLERLLKQREAARSAGDALARAVLDHLEGKPVDLADALCGYRNADGPAWALPPRWEVVPGALVDTVEVPK